MKCEAVCSLCYSDTICGSQCFNKFGEEEVDVMSYRSSYGSSYSPSYSSSFRRHTPASLSSSLYSSTFSPTYQPSAYSRSSYSPATSTYRRPSYGSSGALNYRCSHGDSLEDLSSKRYSSGTGRFALRTEPDSSPPSLSKSSFTRSLGNLNTFHDIDVRTKSLILYFWTYNKVG